MPIVIKRSKALGDIILSEPLIRFFAESEKVFYLTEKKYAEIFRHHPNLESVIFDESEIHHRGQVIDLDNSYEQTLHLPINEAYFKYLGLETKDFDLKPRLYFSDELEIEKDLAVVDIGYPGSRQYYQEEHWSDC